MWGGPPRCGATAPSCLDLTFQTVGPIRTPVVRGDMLAAQQPPLLGDSGRALKSLQFSSADPPRRLCGGGFPVAVDDESLATTHVRDTPGQGPSRAGRTAELSGTGWERFPPNTVVLSSRVARYGPSTEEPDLEQSASSDSECRSRLRAGNHQDR